VRHGVAVLLKTLDQRARQFDVILDQQNRHCRLAWALKRVDV
jgi:hypothetical protein